MRAVIMAERHRSINAGPRSIAARRLIGVAGLILCSLEMTGCYAFIPTTNPTLPTATPVTVKLSLAGTVAMQSTLGQGVNEVEGTVLRSSGDTLVVNVENMYTTGRQKFASSGTTASIPRPYIEVVEVRTFSRKRTILTVLGGIALAALGTAGVSAVSGSGDGGGGIIQP